MLTVVKWPSETNSQMHGHKLETGRFIQLEPLFLFLFKDETIILQWLPCQVTLMTFVQNKMKAHPFFFKNVV